MYLHVRIFIHADEKSLQFQVVTAPCYTSITIALGYTRIKRIKRSSVTSVSNVYIL